MTDSTFEYIQDICRYRDEVADPKPSWVRITTITMYARQVVPCAINLEKLSLKLGKSIKVRPKGTKAFFEWSVRKPKKGGQNFYNSISIGYTDTYSTKSVKVSTNGSIHVCGCADIMDCQRVAAQLQVLLRHILKMPDLMIPFSSFKIVMINTNFWIGTKLNLYGVQRLLVNKKFDAIYDPGSYVAVTAKFVPYQGAKRVTANIFSSGAIIVTGAECLREISVAYRVLLRSIDTSVRISGSEYTKDGFDRFMGATFDEWIRVLAAKKRLDNTKQDGDQDRDG